MKQMKGGKDKRKNNAQQRQDKGYGANKLARGGRVVLYHTRGKEDGLRAM